MVFLLPALVAFASDVAVLYLHRLGHLEHSHRQQQQQYAAQQQLYAAQQYSQQPAASLTTFPTTSLGGGEVQRNQEDVWLFPPQIQNNTNNNNGGGDDDSEAYFWAGHYYLVPLAVIRLLALLLPLLFHSYTGTAVRFPKLYQGLYVTTLVLIVIHMMGLIFFNPQSLESIVPLEIVFGHYRDQNIVGRLLLQHLHALRRVWWMLVFSALSNACHLIVLQHVKSTAPSRDLWLKAQNQQRQPQSVYFAIRSRRRRRQRLLQQRHQQQPERGLEQREGVGDGTEYEGNAMDLMDGLESDYYYDDDEEGEEEPALVNAVNEFLVDVQVRLRRAKQEWSKRLDDFARNRMQDQATLSSVSSSTTAPRSLWPNSNSLHHHHHNPFRVLLQLFAEQDVFENGLLTAAFNWDHGQTLTFLVPQLLSFLLHGATTSSEQLEEWVLQQCRSNIFFAHRCYWFLRAWCLEVPGDNTTTTGSAPTSGQFLSLSRENSDCHLSALLGASETAQAAASLSPQQPQQQQLLRRVPSGSVLVTTQQQQAPLFLDQPALAEKQQATEAIGMAATTPVPPYIPSAPTSGNSVNSGVASICRPSMTVDAASVGGGGGMPDKFMPQERAMIERLMLRVKECGESAARVLEYGRNNKKNKSGSSAASTAMSASSIMQVVEQGAVPIDPVSGRPSQRHLDCMAASRKYGFRPIVGNNNNESVDVLSEDYRGDSTEQFDKTPQFFDALIYIAELLFTVPRETRKDELHNLLRQLECELLPDNAVYVPSTSHSTASQLGRVWRIAVPECIPISTKERVPCILALEVVQWNSRDEDDSEDDDDAEEGRYFNMTTPLSCNKKRQPDLRNMRDSTISNGSNNHRNSSGGLASTLDTTASSSPSAAAAAAGESAWSLLDLPKRFSLSTRSESVGKRDNNGGGLLSAESILSTPGPLRHMVSNDHKTQSDGDAESSDATTAGTRTAESSLMDCSASSLLPRGRTTGSVAHHHRFVSEAELVRVWRSRPRNPLRLIPLINRVGETMKGTMDRVKTTMQERFNDLRDRDRSVNEELQSLTQHHLAVDDEEGGGHHPDGSGDLKLEVLRTPAAASQDQLLLEEEHLGSGHHSSCMDSAAVSQSTISSPPPPPNHPPSMGQWSSPAIGSTTPRKRAPQAPSTTSNSTATATSSTLRHRSTKLDSSGHNKKTNSAIVLPYGSGDGNDKNRRRNAESLADGPSSANGAATGVAAKPPPVVFRESWQVKQERVRQNSAYGSHPGWRLAPILIKANDDLRQEELASQLIYRMASILAREKVPVWLCPYEIIALTDQAGLIEAIPDTISLDSLKRNDPNFTSLRNFFIDHYGEGTEELSDAKANFVESLAAYSMVCFLLQIKDRHNGNILIDSRGHVIHIDFGFFFLSSPGKNAGFESAPFKLTRDFMEVMDGPHSHLFHVFRELCVRSFLALRKHCMEIIVLVEMIQSGNEKLKCFRGRPDRAIAALRERFRLDLNDRACREYVHSLVDDSMENWRTDWYDRYQRYFVGVL